MNTAELPKLRTQPTDEGLPSKERSFAAEPRWRALEAAGAWGHIYTFLAYDVVIGARMAWIAQDDWLPEPGDYDFVADEWPKVVSLISQYVPDDLGEPWYDRVNGVWVWSIQRP